MINLSKKLEKVVLEEVGFISDSVPPDIFTELLSELNVENYEKQNKYNGSLAGQIEKEYEVSNLLPQTFYNYLGHLTEVYYNNFPSEAVSKKLIVNTYSAWLNVQKKYEYNPLHNHHGDLSYVMWIKIPYNLQDELNYSNSISSRAPLNSLFSFCSPSHIIHGLSISSENEGGIILFKSSLLHQVYPFYTSDEYRISLAGNIHINWLTEK